MYYANEVSYFELFGLGAFFNVKFTSKIDQNFILNSIFFQFKLDIEFCAFFSDIKLQICGDPSCK